MPARKVVPSVVQYQIVTVDTTYTCNFEDQQVIVQANAVVTLPLVSIGASLEFTADGTNFSLSGGNNSLAGNYGIDPLPIAAGSSFYCTFTASGWLLSGGLASSQTGIAGAPPVVSGFVYGNGADGTVTFDGVAAVAGTSRVGSVYTQTRDVNYNNATVNAGVTLVTANFNTVGQQILNNQGTINNNGPAGGNGTGAAGGTGGTGIAAGTLGASGGGGAGGFNAAGTGGVNATGSAGGNGGAGGAATNAGGVGGVAAAPTATTQNLNSGALFALTGQSITGAGVLTNILGGAGGGGGGSAAATAGGGGGGAAGAGIRLAFPTINNGGAIQARGGAGGNAFVGGGAAGGGGGGGGGFVDKVARLTAGAGTIDANGGAAGAAAGGGAAGVAGSNGTIFAFAA